MTINEHEQHRIAIQEWDNRIRKIKKLGKIFDYTTAAAVIALIVLAFVFPKNAPGLPFLLIFIFAAWGVANENEIELFDWSVFRFVMYRLYVLMLCALFIGFMTSPNINWNITK